MDDKQIETMIGMASALGWLRGHIIADMLYSDISVSQFENKYNTLKRSYEYEKREIDESDILRIKRRADELNATIVV
jgi:hypothetical protein